MIIIDVCIMALVTILFIYFRESKWKNETIFVTQIFITLVCLFMLRLHVEIEDIKLFNTVQIACVITTVSEVVLSVYTIFFRKRFFHVQ